MKTRLPPTALLRCSAVAWSGEVPPAFSSLPPGQALPKEFRIVALPKIAKNNFSLVADDGKTNERVTTWFGDISLRK